MKTLLKILLWFVVGVVVGWFFWRPKIKIVSLDTIKKMVTFQGSFLWYRSGSMTVGYGNAFTTVYLIPDSVMIQCDSSNNNLYISMTSKKGVILTQCKIDFTHGTIYNGITVNGQTVLNTSINNKVAAGTANYGEQRYQKVIASKDSEL